MKSDCIFCDLLKGKLEVSLVYQGEVCSAFMDIQPINPGHMLVVPNRHAANLLELDPAEGAEMFRVGQRLAAALEQVAVKCEGINFFLANGEAAGQEVFHIHLHVLPRYQGDGFALQLPTDYANVPERVELDHIAMQVKQALG
jgi:histidine triad (HIT) family protein